MLTRKYFIAFADFMANLFNRNTALLNTISRDIDLIFDIPRNQVNNQDNIKEIKKIIEKRLLDYYNNTGLEMQLLLDKNSLRFNKYMFKNYIIAKSERDATKIRLNQQSEVNMDWIYN